MKQYGMIPLNQIGPNKIRPCQTFVHGAWDIGAAERKATPNVGRNKTFSLSHFVKPSVRRFLRTKHGPDRWEHAQPPTANPVKYRTAISNAWHPTNENRDAIITRPVFVDINSHFVWEMTMDRKPPQSTTSRERWKYFLGIAEKKYKAWSFPERQIFSGFVEMMDDLPPCSPRSILFAMKRHTSTWWVNMGTLWVVYCSFKRSISHESFYPLCVVKMYLSAELSNLDAICRLSRGRKLKETKKGGWNYSGHFSFFFSLLYRCSRVALRYQALYQECCCR